MRRLVAAIVFASLPLLAACGPEPMGQPQVAVQVPPGREGQDIASVVAGSRQLETMARAIEAAGLTERLSGGGPFTLFAPTNAAFDRLPPGTLDQLFEPQNHDILVRIVTYHLVEGERRASDLAGQSQPIESLEGTLITIDGNRQPIRVGGGDLAQADIAASNGVIHVIGAVLLP